MTTRALVAICLFSLDGCGGGDITAERPAADVDDPPDGDGAGPSPDDSDEGSIEAWVVYDGARRFAGADVYLLAVDGEADPCSDNDLAVPSGAVSEVSLADALGQAARFEDLPRGSRFAVVAAALDETGVVSALGCSSPVEVPRGAIEVEVIVGDVPASLRGAWELESHLRVIEGIPLDTRLVLGILDEMTDDANDPATFLLDLLLAQFIEDESLRTGLGWVRQSAGIDRSLNEKIRDWAPALLLDTADASGDLVRALDDLRIDSRLEIAAPDAEGVAVAEHQLLDLVFEVDDRDTRFSISDDVGLWDTAAQDVVVTLDGSGRVDLGSHTFQVGLGTVALFALHEVVLPRLAGAPRDLGQMLAMLVDCREVGDWLSVETGIGSDDDWEDACVLGLEGIGSYLELQILSLDEQLATLALEGHAETQGDKVVPRELQDGEWDVAWSGAAGTLPFGGEFAALRSDSGGVRGGE